MKLERASGVLLHITSLPGTSGIGTLGPEARAFADLLQRAGMRYWQVLPVGPVERRAGYSPYASPSSFAGNWMFLSMEDLAAEEWCGPGILPTPVPEGHTVDFEAIERVNLPLLEGACGLFFERAPDEEIASFERFVKREAEWLGDWALYASIAEECGTGDWLEWGPEQSLRDRRELVRTANRLEGRVRFHQFIQYQFFRQWHSFKKHCEERGIGLIGDIPIYVIMEGADAWANPDILLLDEKTRKPLSVAGVPPDYFSDTGQRWGNPLYRWKSGPALAGPTFRWWERRIRHLRRLVDIIRIDHFRGFEAFWSIPAEEATAVRGKWVKGPGIRFFRRLRDELGNLHLIAEDLGVITPEVEKLRDDLELPGMRILQFAFDRNNRNYYLPHNIDNHNCVLYTGTHDNNTTNGWFYGPETGEEIRNYILEYLGLDDWSDFHWKLIRQAYRSVADLVIIPAQDIAGFGPEHRMNMPGTAEGNWRFKLAGGSINGDMVMKLRRMAQIYTRLNE